MSGIIFEEALRSRRAATVAGAVLVALALGVALWAGPTGAQQCPPGEPDCQGPNRPPDVDADDASVVVVQGQTATNTGTYSDDETSGEVDIRASVGNVTKTGINSGTWSWSLANAAPLGRQQVTITATDSYGTSSTTEFTLSVTLPNGKIAFSSDADIYTINPNGSGRTNLTNDNFLALDFEPAFSPDGTRIAFRSDRDGNAEIYVMNANGGGLRRLTTDPAPDHDPAFSPDGTRIAFTRYDPDSTTNLIYHIYIMNADGSGTPTRLTNDPTQDFDPAFSPDGSQIAFERNRDIYVMNADGSGTPTRLTSAGGGRSPAFSPDGSQIAFERGHDIYVMNAAPESATNQPQRLTDTPTRSDVEPSWSPDSTKIAFSSDRDGDYGIYVMNADGSNQTNLTNAAIQPSWGGASDTATPETTITSGPAGLVNSDFAEFGFSSSEPNSIFKCSLDGGPFQLCTSPKTYFALSEGQHTFQVRATDVSGNTDPTPASRTFTVDTTAPNTTIDSGPSGSVNTPSVSFAFSSSETSPTFGCRLTRQGETPGSFTACSSPKEYRDLTDGVYTFEVRATDAAGNTDASPASRTWTVDATAPSAPIITSPTDGSYNNTGDFTVSGTAEAGSAVKLYDEANNEVGTGTAESGSWSVPLSGVPEGSHTYTARATDAAGNTSGVSNELTVTVDVTASTTTTTPSPAPNAAGWNKEDVTVTLEATDNTGGSGVKEITYSATGANPIAETTVAGSSAQVPITTEGETTITYFATDNVGNAETPQSFTVKLDKSAPTVSATTPTRKTGVSPTNPNISATFSEKVNKATVVTTPLATNPLAGTSSTVKVRNLATGKPVAATVSCDAEQCQTATITPARPLAKNTKYKATVTSGVQDLAGNALDQNKDKEGNQAKSWTFTTGSR